jgi:hypothetical protein
LSWIISAGDHTPNASQKLVEEPVTRTPPHLEPIVPY